MFSPMTSRSAARYILGALAVMLLPLPVLAEAPSDPMRPPQASVYSTSAKKSVIRYHLSSIVISPSRRSAIINGKSVTTGDRVGNARVTEIQGTRVRISIAGKIRTLSLLPLNIKKPAEASRQ